MIQAENKSVKGNNIIAAGFGKGTSCVRLFQLEEVGNQMIQSINYSG